VKALLMGLGVIQAASWAHPVEARTHAAAGRNGVSAMVARVLAAVVSITAHWTEFDDLSRPVPKRGLGSGFIVDRQGYILTNNHVIETAEEITVELPDQRVFQATPVGGDPFTDLAVLKIEGKNLPTVSLGESARVQLGESVVAIGYPLWIDGGPTVTVGVVSGLGRSMEEPDGPDQPMLHNLIQTDAAINPGNSGGPLLNLAGRVVGINVAYMASAQTIGFAIPINTAKSVFRTLIASGRIARPSLGLVAVSVTPQVAHDNNLQVEQGVLVVQVEPGGPGDAAGLKPGDVITFAIGEAIKNLHHFHELLTGRRPGEVLELIIWRKGQTLALQPIMREQG
jgi:serine protease Do